VREREDENVQAWFRAGKKPRTMPEFLHWLWQRMSAPSREPQLRLLFELYALALRNPRDYPGILEDPLAYWQKLTKRASVHSKSSAAEATLLLAATRGLLLDLCATGDRARVSSAMQLLARLVESRDEERATKNTRQKKIRRKVERKATR
jgi:hypothetical protein